MAFDPSKIGPKDADTQRKEAKAGTYVPPTGTYHVVGTHVRRKTTSTGKQAIRLSLHILAASPEAKGQKIPNIDATEYKDAVGKTFSIDAWLDFSKNRNAMFLTNLCHAVLRATPFDEGDDKACAEALTGTAFKIEIEQRQRDYQKDGKTVEIVEAEPMVLLALAPQQRKQYTTRPDWDAPGSGIVPDLSERVLEPFTPRGGGGYGGKATSTYDFDDGVAPASNKGSLDPDDVLPF